jgi:luciferase family oxidoreductase group 1
MPVPFSILDLALIAPGESPAEAFAASVDLARAAEAGGYRRVWYAEHHNIPSIASSATAVLIAHVATRTRSIRLGAGGVMLPNHSPLVVAEQFGTLESLHPGRIDLGLGRAPGSDQKTARALRRSPDAADSFPDDVLELQAYLAGESVVPGVDATPGKGLRVPLYILGSSLFGAQLAAALGLPFGFASHFAPDLLHRAVALYRSEFRPSRQAQRPHVIAGANVLAAETRADAEAQRLAVRRARVNLFLAPGRRLADAEADAVLETPGGRQVDQMMRCSAVGTQAEVRAWLKAFAVEADADELITSHLAPRLEDRLRSVALCQPDLE